MKVVLLSRKKRISTRYLELRSMQLVAKEFNLSRERIRQICIIELGQDKIDKIKKQNNINLATDGLFYTIVVLFVKEKISHITLKDFVNFVIVGQDIKIQIIEKNIVNIKKSGI